MDGKCRFNQLRIRMALTLAMLLLYQHSDFCWCLNAEGWALLRFREDVVSDPFGALSNWNDDDGLDDPCLWFGVECSEGNVVALNLRDLCLRGTLSPEIRNLIHIKSIVLRNNSFFGIVPKEIGELKELELLDLGYNNFSGPLPTNLGNNLSLSILLLDNNKFLGATPELHELNMLSELQIDENLLSNAAQGISCNRRTIPWNSVQARHYAQRRLLTGSGLNAKGAKTPPVDNKGSLSPSPSPLPSPSPSPPPSPSLLPSPSPKVIAPSPSAPPPVNNVQLQSSSGNPKFLIWFGASVAAFFLCLSVIGILYCRRNKVVTVKPWSTGLSGQLQKAFITGVPKLKRSELETACEDFSNIIDSSSEGTMYKGTLSSGVEIAVISISLTSAKDWSKNFECQFRKKIDTMSKVNHKNFVNLLGYCEEEEPFTRMMVFEYAPNGTLFEHLHIKESEHLDWGTRLRIAMGMAYCLEYMHQLTPPLILKNLNSSVVYLTEDYAAKISDFGLWNDIAASNMGSTTMDIPETLSSNLENNIYTFGLTLLEMITGRLPYSVDNISLIDWASVYFRGEQPLKGMVDPTLKSFQEEELKKLLDVIRCCVHLDPKQRPTMREVTAQLREITAMGPDRATPKLSPLWWAELEIQSTEAS
ncbi:PREDICTED: inactive receptor-like serine/threonine-protein kinase At2g40270 [Nelumbo nucifera]|uniref:Inactive receptor-like serine/threonine-protein kinase At2g40270 n=1 Tax=Nelumbo nucifera TaxID=4432 RepID=A0A1U8AAS9_NELNU|nr:PREDICTED: inactive receptor-like serine/threonine-protein kinase At2g40270 [Nelumbo nucifera]